jgi:hypothetical protein
MQRVAPATRLSFMSLLVAAAAGLGASPAMADPLYTLETLIPVPAAPDNQSPTGAFTTYDISFFDANTQMYYLGDRSNAAVDIFSAATNSFVGRVGGSGGLFSGIQPNLQMPNNDISGPNGVLVVNQPNDHVLYVGNGDSTLKAFNLAVAGNPQIANIATGPATDKRVDEMSFAPSLQRLVVANNAADKPFLTVVDTNNNSIVTKIVFDGTNGTPNATNGLEQSVWDPKSQRFYVSVPEVNGGGPGGIAAINPLTNKVDTFYDFSSPGLGALTACAPAGLAISAGGELMVGCGVAGQSVLLNPTANGGKGSVKTFAQVSGEDMVWYDPKTGRFFLAARSNPGGPVLGIIDGNTDEWLENIPTTPGDHSVAVDPVSGEIFVPFGGVAGNTVCPNGCIAVYALVPEPGSLSVLAVSLIGLAGFVSYRRRRV